MPHRHPQRGEQQSLRAWVASWRVWPLAPDVAAPFLNRQCTASERASLPHPGATVGVENEMLARLGAGSVRADEPACAVGREADQAGAGWQRERRVERFGRRQIPEKQPVADLYRELRTVGGEDRAGQATRLAPPESAH